MTIPRSINFIATATLLFSFLSVAWAQEAAPAIRASHWFILVQRESTRPNNIEALAAKAALAAKGFTEIGETTATLLTGGCGFAGCDSTYLVSTAYKTAGANPKTAVVAGVVIVQAVGGVKVQKILSEEQIAQLVAMSAATTLVCTKDSVPRNEPAELVIDTDANGQAKAKLKLEGVEDPIKLNCNKVAYSVEHAPGAEYVDTECVQVREPGDVFVSVWSASVLMNKSAPNIRVAGPRAKVIKTTDTVNTDEYSLPTCE